MTCDSCSRTLDRRASTGTCARCRMAAADFLRQWIGDLRSQGLSPKEIAPVVGVTADLVRLRLREQVAA
jgi:hypothetical protein